MNWLCFSKTSPAQQIKLGASSTFSASQQNLLSSNLTYQRQRMLRWWTCSKDTCWCCRWAWESDDQGEYEEYESQGNTADDEEDNQPLEIDLQDRLTEEEQEDLNMKIQPIHSMLTKLSWTIIVPHLSLTLMVDPSSTSLHMWWKIQWPFSSQWSKTLTSASLPHRMMPQNVSMQWNLTFDMFHFALEFCPTLTQWLQCTSYCLREEWCIAKELRNVLEVFHVHSSSVSLLTSFLKIFKDVTLFFSCGTPNLTTIIPVMDHIDGVLATQLDSSQYSLPVHTALAIGRNTINHYYNKMDYLEVYHIAMGM